MTYLDYCITECYGMDWSEEDLIHSFCPPDTSPHECLCEEMTTCRECWNREVNDNDG